ncbi:unnamed protein product [Brachionus calyciflorus]|uniref:Uncharacterized protein n=1 Tax=Brachionus calyciflorus TaxID=104777 RepID=A0A813U986_9BILA|nr:unnamed protein product [Brachionus calyciflorus]
MEWLFKCAKESSDFEIRQAARKIKEKIKSENLEVSDTVKSLWEELQNEQVESSERRQESPRELKYFLLKVIKNLEYNVVNQKKFTQISLNNFINKSNHRELAETLKIGFDSTDNYLETTFKLIEELYDEDLNALAKKVVYLFQQQEIEIPESVWEKWYQDQTLQINQSALSENSRKEETNNVLLTTLCSFTQQMSLKESLKSLSHEMSEGLKRCEFQTVKWTNDDITSQVVSFFDKDKILTDSKNEPDKKHINVKIKSFTHVNVKNRKAEFFRDKQRVDESVEQFGERLLNYLKDLCIQDKKELEKHLTEVFIDGVSKSIKILIISDSSLNFKEVWEKAKKIEKCIQYQEESGIAINESKSAKTNRGYQKFYFDENAFRKPTCQFCGKSHYTTNCYQWNIFQENNKDNCKSNRKYPSRQSKSKTDRRVTFSPQRYINSKNNLTLERRESRRAIKCNKCYGFGHFANKCNINK